MLAFVIPGRELGERTRNDGESQALNQPLASPV
jgi:hypothetical protein